MEPARKTRRLLPLAQAVAHLDRAIELGREVAALGEVPVGAVILAPGPAPGLDAGWTELAHGANQREREQDPTAHAEVVALRAAARAHGSWRLEGCVAFVSLEPCPMCLGALQQARIAKVVFAALDPKGGALSLGYRLETDPRTHHRFAAEYLERSASARLLKEFFQSRRRGGAHA